MQKKSQFLRNFTCMGSKIPDYSTWTKNDLIKRILTLEHEILLKKNIYIEEEQIHEKLNLNNKNLKKSKKPFLMSNYNQRYVAFKFAYLGWYYNGLVTQGNETPLPTVEETIFLALKKAKLIDHESNCKFSRCGRTDKGVSAIGQVMALNVRSNKPINENSEEKWNEIKYMDILNKLLPESIRILAWCSDLPSDFSARFSCKRRHYKYLFFKDSFDIHLDIEKMSKAASYFIGEHDFRNFCKLNPSKQTTNFRRTIIKSEIKKSDIDISDHPLYIFDLEGTGFLWHQVRCMIAILFLVGQNLEDPEIVKTLLDISKTPQKPIYDIAHDLPLILYNCHFENLNWNYDTELSFQKLYKNIYNLWHKTKIQNSIVHYLLKSIQDNRSFNDNTKKILIKDGTGISQSLTKYVQIENRKTIDNINLQNE
ncbi:hypothetical protein PCANB_001685 [Pneumocystis canis]|nr:hypothetical protein PCK1_002083 [Pneumocystis canis]KAG5440117.1 hypothetical protein PCANB_001685 [Pneumocystis canis]